MKLIVTILWLLTVYEAGAATVSISFKEALLSFGDDTKTSESLNRVQSIFLSKNQEDSQCEACQEIIKSVEELIKNHASDEQMRETLLKVCALFPALNDDESCEDFMQYGNYDELVSFIDRIQDPKLVCMTLKLCNYSEEKTFSVSKLSAFKAVYGLNKFTSVMSKISASTFNRKKAMKLDAKDSNCETCQKIFKSIEEEVVKHAPKEEIMQTYLEICKLQPPRLSNCEEYVKHMDDELFNVIISDIIITHDPRLECAFQLICDFSKARPFGLVASSKTIVINKNRPRVHK